MSGFDRAQELLQGGGLNPEVTELAHLEDTCSLADVPHIRHPVFSHDVDWGFYQRTARAARNAR